MPERARALYESYVGWCLRVAGRPGARSAAKNAKLRHALEQAHLEYLPEAFVALAWVNTVLAVLVAYVLVGIAAITFPLLGHPIARPILVVLVLLPPLLGMTLFVAQSVFPDYRAGERRRKIDRDLPYAVNYIAAMSSAGIVPTTLLADLAREPTYGEVTREVAWLIRDIDLLGIDLLTAINRAIQWCRQPKLRGTRSSASTRQRASKRSRTGT